MCGQLGLILAPRERTHDELDYLTDMFGAVLWMSKQRGRHATGVARVQDDGTSAVYKRAVPSNMLIRQVGYTRCIAAVDNRTTVLMGHTRWATVGSAEDPKNAHPIRAGVVVGTANGTITNADQLFRKFKLPRHAEVDSEVIFRMAGQTLDADNRIDVHVLAERLTLCKGSLAAVVVATTDPECVVLVKRDKPLEMVYNERYGVLFYASDLNYLNVILDRPHEWLPVDIPWNTLVVVDSTVLNIKETVPLGRTVKVGR